MGRVSNVGSRYYGMQIWVYPDRLADMGLTVKDLQDALKDQNRESAAGEFGKQPILDVDVTMPVTASGRLSTVEEFENIVIRANSDGSIGSVVLFNRKRHQWKECSHLVYLYVAGSECFGGGRECACSRGRNK